MVVAIGCLDYLFGTVNSNYVFRSQPEYGVPGINRTVPIYFCISGEIYKSLKCNKKKNQKVDYSDLIWTSFLIIEIDTYPENVLPNVPLTVNRSSVW